MLPLESSPTFPSSDGVEEELSGVQSSVETVLHKPFSGGLLG